MSSPTFPPCAVERGRRRFLRQAGACAAGVAAILCLPAKSGRAAPEDMRAAIRDVIGDQMPQDGRIKVPATAKRGGIIEIKTLIAHPMETGYRTGPNGAMLARDIIRRFVCTYNGEEIFSADFSPAIAANPFLTFFTRATESGRIILSWSGDNGFSANETVEIDVS